MKIELSKNKLAKSDPNKYYLLVWANGVCVLHLTNVSIIDSIKEFVKYLTK